MPMVNLSPEMIRTFAAAIESEIGRFAELRRRAGSDEVRFAIADNKLKELSEAQELLKELRGQR